MSYYEQSQELHRQAALIDRDAFHALLDAWDAHCAEAGHIPASNGGGATFSSGLTKHHGWCEMAECGWRFDYD